MDPETVGQMTESIARFFGTGRYLLLQTILVLAWIAVNLFAATLLWDPYPFILLNLAFSTQAAYAAPLILLAQNRQENRDRVALDEDRRRAAQTKADTEYLARELAALRLAVGEVVTREYPASRARRSPQLAGRSAAGNPGDGDRAGPRRPGKGPQEIPVNTKSTIAPLPSRELCMVIKFTKLRRGFRKLT
jgi:uncharacterized membrane protein